MTSLSLNLLNLFQSSCLMSGHHLTLFVLLTTCCTFRFCEIHLPRDLLLFLSPWQSLPAPIILLLLTRISLGFMVPGQLNPFPWHQVSLTSKLSSLSQLSCWVSYYPSGFGLDVPERPKSRTTHHTSSTTTKTYPLPHVLTQWNKPDTQGLAF